MRKLFNDLLVPMDISDGNLEALRKAIDLANRLHCHVHLLYFSRSAHLSESLDHSRMLKEELENCRALLLPSLSLFNSSPEGPLEKAVIAYCKKNRIDLLLLEKKRSSFSGIFRDSLCADELAKNIDCPILTGGMDSDFSDIRNIVLPVGHFLPMGKLLLATYLARLAGSTIHLVSLGTGKSAAPKAYTDCLSRSYHLLKDNTSLSIETRVLPGANIASVALAYARSIEADLIMVNPGRESHLSGFLRGLRRNFLFDISPIPVMTVS